MADAADGGGTRGRILVCDDEPHIRRILATLLETSFFDVDTVADGEAALEALRSDRRYDLVLLDIMMPGTDGLGVLQEVRSLDHRGRVPIVILTAKGQDTDRDRALELGATAFVTKPFSPKKLLVRIQDLLE